MMKPLRIHPRPGHVLYYPGLKYAGQFSPYIGRSTVILPDGRIDHPCLEDAVELDPSSPAGLRVIERMMLDRQDPPFYPADEHTARTLNVVFVPVEFADGEFYPVKPKAPKLKVASE